MSWDVTHRIHGTGIFTCIWLKLMVYKCIIGVQYTYSIHGACGYVQVCPKEGNSPTILFWGWDFSTINPTRLGGVWILRGKSWDVMKCDEISQIIRNIWCVLCWPETCWYSSSWRNNWEEINIWFTHLELFNQLPKVIKIIYSMTRI